jgi:fatty acyl-CoA reductase
MSSQVAAFYSGKSVFVTGGTGFLGISVVEKILRCCPDVKNIYLLIRPRKGKSAQDRMQDVIKNSASTIIYVCIKSD